MKFMFSEEVSFDGVLKRLIDEAKVDRDVANSPGSHLDVDTKRAVATVVTKLEEARMWRTAGRAFFDEMEE